MSSNFAKKRERSGRLTPRKVLLRSNLPDGLSESSNGTGARTSLSPLGLAFSVFVSERDHALPSYVCHLDAASLPSMVSTLLSTQTVFALPLSRLLPRIRLRTRQAPALLGQKILVTIDRWDAHSRYPEGHLVRALGKAEDKETEQESLLLEFEVPYRPFGKAILDCLPPEGDQWVVPPKDPTDPIWRDRMDLRELDICSIDPPGAWLSVRKQKASFKCKSYRMSGYRRRPACSPSSEWVY